MTGYEDRQANVDIIDFTDEFYSKSRSLQFLKAVHAAQLRGVQNMNVPEDSRVAQLIRQTEARISNLEQYKGSERSEIARIVHENHMPYDFEP